jgi:phosphoribosylformylglycinamidine cyclo-ligase
MAETGSGSGSGGTRERLSYASSGVDIDAKMGAVARARDAIRSTFTPGVVGDVGGFGGLFRPDFSGMTDPLLVASADGVGTKLKVAVLAGIHDTVGQDLVNHCVNDILVQGARPLFFLDYVAAGRLDKGVIGEVLSGLARACRENGCALLGGETAEMPGMYAEGDYDLAGTIVGVVDRPRLLDGSKVRPGDLLVGLASSGLHTNGYSLARKVIFERMGLGPGDPLPGFPPGAGAPTAAEALLAVHRSYLRPVLPLVEAGLVSAMAHITGGGFQDNIPRVLPEGVAAEVETGSWEWPPLFRLLAERGGVPKDEMLRVFNCGIGLVLVVPPASLDEVGRRLSGSGEAWRRIGRIVEGPRRVVLA